MNHPLQKIIDVERQEKEGIVNYDSFFFKGNGNIKSITITRWNSPIFTEELKTLMHNKDSWVFKERNKLYINQF